jgi:hypothetical protein
MIDQMLNVALPAGQAARRVYFIGEADGPS